MIGPSQSVVILCEIYVMRHKCHVRWHNFNFKRILITGLETNKWIMSQIFIFIEINKIMIWCNLQMFISNIRTLLKLFILVYLNCIPMVALQTLFFVITGHFALNSTILAQSIFSFKYLHFWFVNHLSLDLYVYKILLVPQNTK